MTDTLDSLRRKVDSATELGSVVRTMKALAAASVMQYEHAVAALDDYYRTVEMGLVCCLRQTGVAWGAERKPRGREVSVAAVVFGSDQGLDGGFNEALADFAARALGRMPGAKEVLVVGERAQSYLADAGVAAASSFAAPNAIAAVTALVGPLLLRLQGYREQGRADEVWLFHNRSRPGKVYEPEAVRLLPLDAEWQAGLARQPWPASNLPEVVGAGEATLQALVREYLFISLYRACAVSLASENASRLAAMQRAEKNIGELMEDLGSAFRALRQSAIDEELFDVVSGFEALKNE
ncbi:MAG TPA: F0F1 ATP synthase subunit gamma [Gallionellaceae bacterium]|nr:F0F1 ATP synthase subunit gamma [Gallionellaceae bacterium]